MGQIRGEHIRYILGHALKTDKCKSARRRWADIKPIETVSDSALHTWINRHFPRLGICAECGSRGSTEYASINGHNYVRPRDWQELHEAFSELCRSCHLALDGHPRYRKAS